MHKYILCVVCYHKFHILFVCLSVCFTGCYVPKCTRGPDRTGHGQIAQIQFQNRKPCWSAKMKEIEYLKFEIKGIKRRLCNTQLNK